MLWCMKRRAPLLGKCLVHFCTWLHPRRLQGVRAGPERRSRLGSIATKEIWGLTMFSRARNGQRCQKNDLQNGKYSEARWQKHASCRGSTQCIKHRVKRGRVFLERSSTPLRIYCCCDLWLVDSLKLQVCKFLFLLFSNLFWFLQSAAVLAHFQCVSREQDHLLPIEWKNSPVIYCSKSVLLRNELDLEFSLFNFI